MKGVILRTAPRVASSIYATTFPSIQKVALLLQHAAREFPSSTIHCAVVDPRAYRGVLAFTGRDHVWVGPDNGLLDFASTGCRRFRIRH